MYKSPLIAVVASFLLLVTSVQAQPPGRQRGRGPFGRGPLVEGLVDMPEVQEELNVDEVQKDLLDELLRDLRDQRRDRGRRARELDEQCAKLVSVILEPEQQRRFEQLRIQFEGASAFEREEVTKFLDLTSDQLRMIREIEESNRSQAIREARFPGRNLRREAEVLEDVVAVFTEEQKGKWAEMKGESFSFPEPRWFGRRGFGGRGRDPGQGPRRQRPPRDR